MSKHYVTIPELVVADFRSENMGPQVQNWQIVNHVPYAESCARQIWFGSRDVFATFPMDHIADHNVSLHHGPAAYTHLLRLNLGLLSRKQGETNIAGQFYSGWQKMHNEHPDKAQPYDKLIQHLTADSRLIRGRILSGWRTKDSELVARDLSGMQAGDSALIIGYPNKEGKLSPITDSLMRKLTSNDNRRASVIAITHPDPEVANALFKDMRFQCERGRIMASPERLNFVDLPVAMEVYDRVYITMPMGENPDADAYIINAWQNRQMREGSITHLRADFMNMGQVSKAWKDAALDSYIGPEQIRDDMILRGQNNDLLIQRAEQAISLCVKMRLAGQQPSARLLAEIHPGLIPG